ncbi:hypothetical protein Nepgr_030907 [Nepenthes gracilis]|uniref:Uncharacterized protein n=1 Tax=Nepenthes gracilis TaxID=150966 RepID=A0AAD3TH31_NEPGR|nr:hypothetical protein Nepgr_030907 [Nepenthes gracilis]
MAERATLGISDLSLEAEAVDKCEWGAGSFSGQFREGRRGIQDQLVFSDSVEAIAPGAYASTPPGEVQGVGALPFNSNSVGIFEDSKDSKSKKLSPLACEIATQIKILLCAVDKSAH